MWSTGSEDVGMDALGFANNLIKDRVIASEREPLKQLSRVLTDNVT